MRFRSAFLVSTLSFVLLTACSEREAPQRASLTAPSCPPSGCIDCSVDATFWGAGCAELFGWCGVSSPAPEPACPAGLEPLVCESGEERDWCARTSASVCGGSAVVSCCDPAGEPLEKAYYCDQALLADLCPKAGECLTAACLPISPGDPDPYLASGKCMYQAAADGAACAGGTCAAGVCVP